MTHRKTLSLALAALVFTGLPVGAEEKLPAAAKKVSLEEFKALADGKTVDVEIFDLGVPVTATLVWNWDAKTITGTALVNNKDKIDVNSKLSFEGEKACAENDGKPTCHVIYVDGDKFYEVRDDGGVHAVSTLQN